MVEFCTFCGDQVAVAMATSSSALASYSTSCTTSVLSLLHIEVSHPVATHVLRTDGNLCPPCAQLTRDIDLEFRSVLKFLKNLDLLRIRLAKTVQNAAKTGKLREIIDLNDKIQQEIPLVNQGFETFSNLLRFQGGNGIKAEIGDRIANLGEICKQEMLILPEIKDEPLSDFEDMNLTNLSSEILNMNAEEFHVGDLFVPSNEKKEDSDGEEESDPDADFSEISTDSDSDWEEEKGSKKKKPKKLDSTKSKDSTSPKPPRPPKPSYYIPRPKKLKPHACPTCSKTYSTLLSLEKHTYLVHPSINAPSPFPCSICSLPFPTQVDLDAHLATHLASPTPFQCTLCSAVLSNSSQLKSHLSTVHRVGKRSLPCPTCGALFSRQASLVVHQKTHSDSFVGHPCPVCGLQCMSKAVLAVHMDKHAATKQFVCEVCWKGK